MESAKRTRGRSKSKSLSESEPNTNSENFGKETAPNLNGDRDRESAMDEKIDSVDDAGKENEMTAEKLEEPSIEEGAKVPKGKKRKASEVKSEDENANEESVLPKVENASPSVEPDPNVDIKEEPAEVDFNADLQLPSKQTLGKGKRARIPNKRYSDIPMSPHNRQKSAENGSEQIESENDSLLKEVSVKVEPLSPSVVSLKSRTSSGSPLNPHKRQKVSVDLSDPKYLKPFNFGWKRELVWRATNEVGSKRNGDIYYYTPSGKKVRSMREVSENLKNKELSLDNFTFFKDSLGIDDTEKEIIRDAKKPTLVPLAKKALLKATKTPKSPKMPAASPKVLSPKISPPKVATPKVTTPKVTPKTVTTRLTSPRKAVLNETADTPVVKPKVVKTAGTLKMKLSAKKDAKTSPAKPAEKMEVEITPARTPSVRKSGKWSNFNQEVNKPCRPCSMKCEGVRGIVPTLQCRLCLCLYHHECLGLSTEVSQPYVCKNCHLESQDPNLAPPATLSAPPPLTPINTLKTAGGHSTTTLPKLQRIPRPGDTTPLPHIEPTAPNPLPELPKLTPRPVQLPVIVTQAVKATEQSSGSENRSLVGSVTTWLPHNSKIVESTNEELTEASRPQYVEFLGGRKFLVIPKNNFMSVSPTVAATAVTSPDVEVVPTDSARLGSEPVPEIKVEPESPSKPENSQMPEAMEVDGESCENKQIDGGDPPRGENGVEDQNTEAKTQSTPVAVKAKKRTIKLSSITNAEEKEENKFMENYLQNLSYGYNTLLYVFQYLKVQDLLRAGCVCTMWRDIASHPMLWRTVRMKNSQVHSFEGLANTLKKHGTRHLDLRKMLLPTGGDEIWPEFSKAIEKVDTLRRIELCRCPASVVEKLAVSNPQLEVINAVTIKCETMDLAPLKALTNIRELRLKSTGGLTLSSNLDSLKELKFLKHLSLTSIGDLDRLNLNVIGELTNLESLDLGECTDFPKTFGSDILVKLQKLEKLRLEKGQGFCETFEILDSVKDMPKLEQLELVNFDIKSGFDKALGACQNIRKLLIIPTYISQSATTNHMVLGGVLRLQKTLSHFVWGVTLELLRVTELFVDQCEEPKEKKEKKHVGNGDSIPVLKPVPLLMDKGSEIAPALEPPQVEILALPSLQKLLMQNLPTTRVKILKIPFHATWRQSITDSVN
nr:nascent polypeptide-associated complex subunit alpha, muscle-specific form [Leptinotarsa decemlineata]